MGSTTMPLPLSLSFSLLLSAPFHLLHLRGPCISRRQRGHFYPPRSLPPPPVLVPQTTLSPQYSELSPCPSPTSLITLGGLNAFITRPFSLQTFGIGAEGEGLKSWRGWKFEKEENGDRREEGERKMDRHDRVRGCDGVGREGESAGGTSRSRRVGSMKGAGPTRVRLAKERER